MQKILVIQTLSASNLMLDTALFRCMKQQMDSVELHLLTDLSFIHLVQNNPNLDQVFGYGNNLKTLQADFHLHGYSKIVDLQNDHIAQQFIAGLEAEHYYAKAPGLLSRIRTGFKPYPPRIDHVFSIVKDLKVRYDGNGPGFFIPENEQVKTGDIPTAHSAGYICILLSDLVDPNAIKVLCERINHPVIILGTKSDQEAGEDIAASDPVKIYNAAGKFNFNETADLIRKSKLLVAEINEYLYIGVAFGKPTLALIQNKKELKDLRQAYPRGIVDKSKSPVFLYDTALLRKQKIMELGDMIQRMISGT